MEEDKAVAYYDEVTRKGEGAARFKQGLGFPSSSSTATATFVKASTDTSKYEKQSQLESIQEKLKKKNEKPTKDRSLPPSPRRSRSSRDRCEDRKHRSRSRERYRDRERRRESRRERERNSGGKGKEGVDYSRFIRGYDTMAPAERVKARMKLQLDETAEKDSAMGMGMGMGSGWERFDFNRDAPLDDEEVEAAEDDAALVKHIGQSFRFSNVEAKKEEQVKAAHDEAMFGVPTVVVSATPDTKLEMHTSEGDSRETAPATSLLSEKVIARQQGSWRDRARKP